MIWSFMAVEFMILYFIVHFIFYIVNCLLCILNRVFLLHPTVRWSMDKYTNMYICRILPVQLLGCHTEINACLEFVVAVVL